jgi:MFS superfamily sulfate permease-like transporter
MRRVEFVYRVLTPTSDIFEFKLDMYALYKFTVLMVTIPAAVLVALIVLPTIKLYAPPLVLAKAILKFLRVE